MRLGELALVKVCSRTIHTLSLMTVGKDCAAELETVFNSLIQAYKTEVFNDSLGCSKAENRYSSIGAAGLEVRDNQQKKTIKAVFKEI